MPERILGTHLARQHLGETRTDTLGKIGAKPRAHLVKGIEAKHHDAKIHA